MPAINCARKRRQHRRTRLVDATGMPLAGRPVPIDFDDMDVYQTGLHIVDQMQKLFPIEYATGVASRPVTFPQLHLVCEAFLGLVDTRLFPLSDFAVNEIFPARDPLGRLQEQPTVQPDQARADLAEDRFYLRVPNAMSYGLGVQSVLNDGAETDDVEYSLLTLSLWQLFRGTALAIGYDVPDLASHLPRAHRAFLEQLPALPRIGQDQCQVLLDTFALPDGRSWAPRAGILIAYVFGRTGVALADYTDIDVAELFDGEYSDTWEDALAIADASREARSISTDYASWERAVSIDYQRELTLLTQSLHTCISGRPAIIRPPTRSPFLIDMFEGTDDEEENTIPAATAHAIAALAAAPAEAVPA